jgi:hypothetical protein
MAATSCISGQCWRQFECAICDGKTVAGRQGVAKLAAAGSLSGAIFVASTMFIHSNLTPLALPPTAEWVLALN